MHIRTMTLNDYDRVYGLWASDANVGLRNIDDSPDGIGRFLARNPETNFVAEEDGRIVGAILCGQDGRRAYIYHAYVQPDHRQKGIGKSLVDAVLKKLDGIGITKVALTVFCSNELGNKFWDNMGFMKRPDLHYRNKTLDPANE
ncbi:MAG: GNAT family N-acetyltransferase [Clostridia bacterium]|nr:GNAT family N-acetyltransferase [Clostridia bacterium]